MSPYPTKVWGENLSLSVYYLHFAIGPRKNPKSHDIHPQKVGIFRAYDGFLEIPLYFRDFSLGEIQWFTYIDLLAFVLFV